MVLRLLMVALCCSYFACARGGFENSGDVNDDCSIPAFSCEAPRTTTTFTFGYNGLGSGATGFVADASAEICSATARLVGGAPDTNEYTACIYTDNGGQPGTQVGACSAPLTQSSIPATEADVTFENMSAAIVAGSKYWLVLSTSAAAGSPITWCGLPGAVCAGSAHVNVISNDGGLTWSVNAPYVDVFFTLYQQCGQCL